jgi:2-oxoglutarate dehydrogenase E1 component
MDQHLSTFLSGPNAGFIEELYAKFLNDANSVDASWRAFFVGLADEAGNVLKDLQGASWAPRQQTRARIGNGNGNGHAAIAALVPHPAEGAMDAGDPRRAAQDSLRAIMLVRAYRVRGHLEAALDPLNLKPREKHADLDPRTYGFSEADLDREIFLDGAMGFESATLRQLVQALRLTYCGSIGVEYMHIQDQDQRRWLQQRMEGSRSHRDMTERGKRAILERLTRAETFEKFLDKKYTATKRFGLDGGETMIPALEQIIKRGSQLGLKDVVVGMAHRGRLNMLTNFMNKPFAAIFSEFQGQASNPEDVQGSADVKYHLGTSADREFDGRVVHLSLTANPSHLEAINTVVLGKVRAKQDQRRDKNREQVMGLLIHGDAAFAGQGLVPECLDLSQLDNYKVGGTIHFIINNQIGFTTSPTASRSSPYCSDVAKAVQSPIFHVNGDDPEATLYCARLAMEFRQEFKSDVVIDMFCYRRHGHNEGDPPEMTQPAMYRIIQSHPSTRELYSRRLVEEGVATQAEIDGWLAEFDAFLEAEFAAAPSYQADKADWLDGKWSGLVQGAEEHRGDTAIPSRKLVELGLKATEIPERIALHKTVARVIEERREAIQTGEGINWSTAEMLAFATLLDEGYPVRLSGQDSVRGTFVQRHAGVVDQQTEEQYIALRHLGPNQGHFEVLDSALSEEAVLGFEYGFSLTDPKTLTLWEAQFGDFANGAQVLIDQFISSGERKWLRMSGLVLLLPHGYEGQGPEHSSARLERFLQLCAEDNMQVANCSTPANYFHVLRRQLLREFRKPLIMMTPKSLLRHKKAVSKLSDMAEGSAFHRVLHDDAERGINTTVQLVPPEKIRRVVLCSGKVYYDLLDAREKKGVDDVYLMRLEQFYPWPLKSLSTELARFPNAELVWCQEEPKNMGGWTFVDPWLELTLTRMKLKAKRARYVGRPASASTAAGLMSRHLKELESFLAEALA